MNDRAIVGVTAVAVLVLAGGAWFFLPALQSSQRKLDESVGASAERARRTVARFNAESDAASALVDQAGLTADITSERIDSIVNSDHRPAQEALAAEQERLQQMQRSGEANTRALDATFSELEPDAQLSPRTAARFSDNPDSIKRDLAQGAQQREKLRAANRAQVNQALTEVGEALQAQEGEASGRDNPLANRLSGIAFAQEGSAAAREAALRRQQAANRLFTLRESARAHAGAGTYAGAVDASKINEVITTRQQALADARTAKDEAQQYVDELQAQIGKLQSGITEQADLAASARARMESLEERGLNYGEPDAAAKFSAEYNEAAAAYRDATRKEHVLRFGGLANARIDNSGDLLNGGFVAATPGGEIESVPGLVDLQSDLAVAQGDLDGRATQVRVAEAQLAGAEALRSELQGQETQAATQTASLAERIATEYAAYRESADAAAAAEDLAIRKYKDAAKAFSDAQTAQRTITQAAPADLAPEAMERSPYKLIADDNWIGAEAKAEAADAQIAGALVWYGRLSRLQRALITLDQDVQPVVPLADYDRAALEQQIAEAGTNGLELARSATAALENAARDLGNHWTVGASVAAANYVMSLFAEPGDMPNELDQAELRNLAIQNYNEVVKGREDNPSIRPFKQRLEQLHAAAKAPEPEPEAEGSP